MEQHGLYITGSFGFKIRLANHQKVKCLVLVQGLELEVFGVKAAVNLHVMPAGLGAFPIILGRPWLRIVGAIQDWKRGIITLYNKKGSGRIFDMGSKKQVNDVDDEEEEELEDEDTTSSSSSEEESSGTTSSSDEADVAYLLVEGESSNDVNNVVNVEEEEGIDGPYECIEKLMQPKVDSTQKQELIKCMLCVDLSKMEMDKYV